MCGIAGIVATRREVVEAVLPAMKSLGRGAIVNTSSVSGFVGMGGLSAYTASKFAVRGMTKCAALEFGRYNIRVNSVHPGIIETPIWDTIIGTGGPGSNAGPQRAASLDAMASVATPLGFKGDPADIADGVLWLASSESRYVTGAELVIDGGLSVR